MSRRLRAGLTTGLLVTGLALMGAPSASATVQQGIGYATTPAQPYKGNPDSADWLGSYVVNGKQVFCVQFAYVAPDSDELYQPGMALKTKWGTDLPADVAANISYLLLRYGDTKNPDEASALAHLLHTWTASPQNPGQLDPANDFRTIAYDAPAHLAKLPANAQTAVQTLTADATANRGPWTATVVAPNAQQTIGVAGDWGIEVKNASGKGIPNVAVTVDAIDATFPGPDGKPVTTGTVTTTETTPLVLKVTPTGSSPKLDIKLASPADVPVVQDAVQVDTQRIISTGGEKQLTKSAQASAIPPPTTTTPPQVPSKIPAGGSPDAPVAQASMDSSLSGGAIAGILGVLVLGALLMWQLVLRKRERV
ncbi:hypothetical protein [Actinophytocola oryzae]|uniref:TQXA domain-containing protein n=1 Tax=Actinophytocola oryzae TaxID=502181 RepID=A0A4R7V0Y6_9PSEU|nr:hypothetical protein [Actinophytocola oryzae]TDV42224.1 hypothetical protein CLV71_11894 [Actinophytocola oryzae]